MATQKIVKNAYIDWRFGQPTDFNSRGQLVTSFANTKTVIDQVKRNGFNGIVLNTNVPIDVDTGDLKLYDDRIGDFGNRDKNIPWDTWRVVQYAKKLGLDVTIKFNIVDYRNDHTVADYSIGANFNKAKFFQAVGDYEAGIAALAKKYGVGMIAIGTYQIGLDTSDYQSQWQGIVNKIQKVYQGQLTYVTDYRQENVVWSMVDVVGAAGDNSVTARDGVAALSSRYNKPVYLDSIMAPATDPKTNVWGMLLSGQDITKITPDYKLQADTLREILKWAIVDHKKEIAGVSVAEFSPWTMANWIQNPVDAPGDTSRQWNQSMKLGSNFINNPTAERVFTNWFNYSTADVIGTRRNDTLKVYAGDKKIDGGAGRDTVVIANSIKDCRITKDTVNGGFDVDNGLNGIDGNYDMYGVEYVKFTDATVSLIGNYDLSKYGWF